MNSCHLEFEGQVLLKRKIYIFVYPRENGLGILFGKGT